MRNLFRTALVLLAFFPLVTFCGEVEITPGDVFFKAKELEVLVERLRFHMGVPKAPYLQLKVQNAQPHDVFFQAKTLFRKTNRLLFQVTRTKFPAPEISQDIYRPQDVLQLVRGAENNLLLVLKELDLPAGVAASSARDEEVSPSDVFLTIQGLNRQINLLLDRPFSPSDVYMQVTLAIGYGAKQLARFPGVRRIPEATDVPPGRVPSDVYFRLLEGLGQLQNIYELRGLSSLQVDATSLQKENITPSDVFDIASLLVARLDYLHKHNKIEMMPREPFYPGQVYPTDVYRQTGILLDQLEALAKQYEGNSVH